MVFTVKVAGDRYHFERRRRSHFAREQAQLTEGPFYARRLPVRSAVPLLPPAQRAIWRRHSAGSPTSFESLLYRARDRAVSPSLSGTFRSAPLSTRMTAVSGRIPADHHNAVRPSL